MDLVDCLKPVDVGFFPIPENSIQRVAHSIQSPGVWLNDLSTNAEADGTLCMAKAVAYTSAPTSPISEGCVGPWVIL